MTRTLRSEISGRHYGLAAPQDSCPAQPSASRCKAIAITAVVRRKRKSKGSLGVTQGTGHAEPEAHIKPARAAHCHPNRGNGARNIVARMTTGPRQGQRLSAEATVVLAAAAAAHAA